MTLDDDTRATVRWRPALEEAGARDTVAMPVLHRPEPAPPPAPAVEMPERPRWETGPTRVVPLTRPAFEAAIDRAVSRLLRAIYVLVGVFAAAMVATAVLQWLLR